MDFVLKPTLQHMALVKIAISLCARDINRPIKLGKLYTNNDETTAVESLPLPEKFRAEISRFIPPITEELEKWYRHLRVIFLVKRRRNLAELRWTSAGSLDKKRSAAILARDSSLNLETRYTLACHYCLVDEINDLNHEMNEKKDALAWLWSPGLQTDSAFCYIEFRAALLTYNPAAAEFYFAKLSSGKKKRGFYYAKRLLESFNLDGGRGSIDDGRNLEFFAQTLFFFLRRMSEIERAELFKKYPEVLFSCLLVWPYQHLFLEFVNRLKELISPRIFIFILNSIFEKINHGHENCLHRNLLGDFWYLVPIETKKAAFSIKSDSIFNLLIKLLKVGEKDLSRLMLKEADVEEKEKLLLSERARRVYIGLWRREKRWDIFEFFREEAFGSPSAGTSGKFKDITRMKERLELIENWRPRKVKSIYEYF